jgi:hypothetical protein
METAVKATGKIHGQADRWQLSTQHRQALVQLLPMDYANEEFVMLPRTMPVVPTYKADNCAKECGEGDN